MKRKNKYRYRIIFYKKRIGKRFFWFSKYVRYFIYPKKRRYSVRKIVSKKCKVVKLKKKKSVVRPLQNLFLSQNYVRALSKSIIFTDMDGQVRSVSSYNFSVDLPRYFYRPYMLFTDKKKLKDMSLKGKIISFVYYLYMWEKKKPRAKRNRIFVEEYTRVRGIHADIKLSEFFTYFETYGAQIEKEVKMKSTYFVKFMIPTSSYFLGFRIL